MEQPKQVRSHDPDMEETFDRDVDGYREQGYRFARSATPTQYAGDPVPLFLSDPYGEPDPREFASFDAGRRKGTTFVRVLAAVGIALGAAGLFMVFMPEEMRAILADARAQLPAAAPEQPAAQPDQTRLTAHDIQIKDSARYAGPNVQVAATGPSASVASAAPSRQEITAAYQSALQTQPPVAPPVAAAPSPAPAPQAVAPPEPRLPSDELAALMKRARSSLDVGDIASARLLLERAAEAQDASAAFLLAQTYDPAVLGNQDIRNIAPDPAKARSWYEKAVHFGSADAQQRLAQMQN